MQVFRALRPRASGEACSALLACLQKCLACDPPSLALDVAVDVILTLQVDTPCLNSACRDFASALKLRHLFVQADKRFPLACDRYCQQGALLLMKLRILLLPGKQ